MSYLFYNEFNKSKNINKLVNRIIYYTIYLNFIIPDMLAYLYQQQRVFVSKLRSYTHMPYRNILIRKEL